MRLAVVTPWFGAAQRGGAEQQARQVALRLAARGHAVEVLTTRARSFADDWSENYYEPGVERDGALTVRRFTLDARDARRFDEANARLLAARAEDLKPGVPPVSQEDARAFADENINSSALVAHLREARESFRAFLLIPYLYGTTLRGVPAVAARACLQPCLHDEAYAYLPAVAETFRRARRVLFNSEGERETALRLFGPGVHARGRFVGEGVEMTHFEETRLGDALPAALRGARFVLYLGRRDATKNVDLLLRSFRRFKETSDSADLKLVLAGAGRELFDAPGEGVHDLGVVSDATKAALLGAARALFQPSRNESFSRALMEAWLMSRPAAAHRDCPATALAVEAARGGWLAATADEWARVFAAVAAASDEELRALGARGHAYAREHADWDKTIDRYEEVFAELDAEATGRRAPRAGGGLRAVHQLLPDAVTGDAITNHALAIRDHLRGGGFESDIFAKRVETPLKREARLFDGSEIDRGAGLIYHHSIGSEVTAAALAHEGAKCLVYHNVTPAEFFAPYRPGFAWLLEAGRASLRLLARHFPCSVGDSEFNAAELAAAGFDAPGVLPIIVSPDKWNLEPDENSMRDLQDGRTNLLFVGRSAPNKRQDALVEIFAEYLRLDPSARLLLAGEARASDPYSRQLLREIERRGLARSVTVTGKIADAVLLAYYRTAHLYLSASEHEGFGVPLVEAMWFDVPVLARRGAAVAETLGAAGAIYEPEETPPGIARLAHRLARADEELRRRVVAAQRVRREAFTPDALRPVLESLLRRMESAHERRAEVA
ncbi:MAG TPA: glycosyltransferase family 4 protein [Pyrinomonadaceae bacterium]|jgi:glycosyltransferase involved in cell wall biosynthesis|nr:glycosyltransferase family 4 protein [Pyrinomonadaceae bacterium]